MYEIIPGILEQAWDVIEQKIELVKPFARTIHIDLIDGKFAPTTTFADPEPFKKYTQDMFFELHLMVEEPDSYIEAWSKAGFQRFLGQVEHMSDQAAFVTKAQELGEVGLVLDGKTPLSAVKVSWEDLDTMLVMTIDAGASGQAFQPQQLRKIESLATQTLLPLEVDGGVSDRTILETARAGATRFVTTSYLFHQGANPSERYDTLLRLLNGALPPRE